MLGILGYDYNMILFCCLDWRALILKKVQVSVMYPFCYCHVVNLEYYKYEIKKHEKIWTEEYNDAVFTSQ